MVDFHFQSSFVSIDRFQIDFYSDFNEWNAVTVCLYYVETCRKDLNVRGSTFREGELIASGEISQPQDQSAIDYVHN